MSKSFSLLLSQVIMVVNVWESANFELWKLNFEQVKLWTLIRLLNIVIVLVYAKCSKLIT